MTAKYCIYSIILFFLLIQAGWVCYDVMGIILHPQNHIGVPKTCLLLSGIF